MMDPDKENISKHVGLHPNKNAPDQSIALLKPTHEKHMDQIKIIFNECQESFHLHYKYVKVLKSIYVEHYTKTEHSKQQFFNMFMGCMKPILLIFKRTIHIERLIKFIVKFLKYDSDDDHVKELTSSILSSLIQYAYASDKAIRLRSCQLIGLIFNELNEETTISDLLWENITAAMLDRCCDKVPSIRIQGIHALKRLQQPEDAADAVTIKLIQLMIADTSKDVRKAALTCIAISAISYADVLTRVRDVSQEVRKTFFEVMGESVDPKHLSINDRVHILEQGLSDRSPSVQSACTDMVILKWLPVFGNSVTSFLKALDVEDNEEVAVSVTKQILQAANACSTNENYSRIIVPDVFNQALASGTLTCEAALTWRVKVQGDAGGNGYKNGNGNGVVAADEDIPDILPFVQLLQAFVEDCSQKEEDDDHYLKSSSVFTLRQLLQIGQCLDEKDEAGRIHLIAVLKDMAGNLNVDSSLVAPTLQLLSVLHHGETDLIQCCVEILADLQELMEQGNDDTSVEQRSDKSASQALLRLHEIEEKFQSMEMNSPTFLDDEVCLSLEKEADLLRHQLEDQSVRYHIRCLEIVRAYLQLTKLDLKNATLSGLLSWIVPAIEHELPVIRKLGVEGITLYSLLSESMAKKHFDLLWRVVNADEEESEVKITALKSVFDLIAVFPSVLSSTTLPMEVCMSSLRDLIYGADTELRTVVVEGLAKLFIMGRVDDEEVLILLLHLYFGPSKCKTERMVQCLSVFFPSFVKVSRTNRSRLENIIHPFAISIVYPREDAFGLDRNIDPMMCVQYLLDVLYHENHESHLISPRDENEITTSKVSWIVLLAIELLCTPKTKSKMRLLWARILNLPDLGGVSDSDASLLRHVFQQALEESCTKSNKRSVEKLIQKLSDSGHSNSTTNVPMEERSWLTQKIQENRQRVQEYEVQSRTLSAQNHSDSESDDEKGSLVSNPRAILGRHVNDRQSKSLARDRLSVRSPSHSSSESDSERSDSVEASD